MSLNDITDVKIRKLDGTGNVLAFADITLLGLYVVRGFKVMSGENGPWVSMPSQRDKGGNWRDSFFPLNKDARARLTGTILEKYGLLAPPPARSQGAEPSADDAMEPVDDL
ncbi:septation protein SpoVG family protein [bacterium]|nr:septation protein SpoVG family protein [bacterium]